MVKALVFMLVSTMLLASMHALVRYLTVELHPFVIVFFRNVFGLVALLPLIAREGVGSLKTDHAPLYLVRVSIGLAAMLSWFYALSRVPIPNATALSFSSTIFATLCAWLFLKEVMRIRRWLAICAGLLGVVIVVRPGMEGFNSFSLLVIASAMTWGISITIVKKLSNTDSSTCIVGWMSIGLTFLSIWPALFFWQWPSLSQFGWLLLVGCLASSGHYFMTNALRLADTATVMSVDFSRLIWTAILGFIFFGDVLDTMTVIGALVIFISAWYILFREGNIKKQQKTDDTVKA